MTDLPAGDGRRRERIVGVDAARAVALVGMFATHTLPLVDDDGTESVTALIADGRASALFAVLAGVGIALSVPRPADARAHLAAGLGLLVRGVLVGLLGLFLVELGPPVAVILAYYGLLFVVAIPLLRLPAGALAAGAVLAGVGGPVLSHLLRTDLPPGPGPQAGLASLAEPGELLVTLGLTGYYPVLPWTAYLLAGMAVGRLDLRAGRLARRLLVGGAALAALAQVTSAVLVAAAGSALPAADPAASTLAPQAPLGRQYGSTPTDTWWWLAVEIPHSGTPLDLAHTTGTALAVLGFALLLPRAVAWLPAAVGAVPLTLYTLHVVLLAAAADPNGQVLLAHLALAVSIGGMTRMLAVRGPLEALVSDAGRAVRSAVAARDPVR